MKTKHYKSPLFALLLLLWGAVGWQGCDGLFQNESPQIDTFYLDQEFLDYTYLTPGHYWVYREINTGEIDSTYAVLHPVLKGERSVFEMPHGGGYSLEITRLENQGVKYFFRGKWSVGHWYLGDDPITDIENDMSLFSLDLADQNMGAILAHKDHSRPWEDMDIAGEDFKTTFHDSVQFRNKVYKNVVQVQIAPDWESTPWIYQSYFVKDIGVVYREFYDGTAWELIRHGTF